MQRLLSILPSIFLSCPFPSRPWFFFCCLATPQLLLAEEEAAIKSRKKCLGKLISEVYRGENQQCSASCVQGLVSSQSDLQEACYAPQCRTRAFTGSLHFTPGGNIECTPNQLSPYHCSPCFLTYPVPMNTPYQPHGPWRRGIQESH